MTGRDLMPFGKYKGTPLKDVPEDYWNWLKEQDWFEEKWPKLAAYANGDDMSTPKEVANIKAEEALLKDCDKDFIAWWKTAYGERLRIQGEHVYVPYLRVALEAWSCAKSRYSKQPVALTPTSNAKSFDVLQSTKAVDLAKLESQDEDVNF